MTDEINCAFCGKSREEVAKLVMNAKGTAICDECLVVSFAKMSGSKIKFLGPDLLDQGEKS